MKEKKPEKNLSIIDSQDTEVSTPDETIADTENTAIAEDSTKEIKDKKKIKPWILITTIALIVVIIAVGAFTWYQYTTLATYDGGRVTRAELNKYYKAALLAEGITEDILPDVQMVKNNLLVVLATDEVFYKQLENLNLGHLEEEELQALEEDTRAIVDNYIIQNLAAIASGLPEGYSERDLEKARLEFEIKALNEIGCLDFDDFVDLRVKDTIFQRAYEELIPDEEIVPTQEQIQAKYDAILAEQKAAYQSNPALYLNEGDSLQFPLFVPEGIRTVRHILFKIDDETLSLISSLGEDEESEIIYTAILEALLPQAEEVLAMLDAGEITFADAVAQYGEDPGMAYYAEGYSICAGNEMFVPEFTAAAMSLTEVGQYTGLVSSVYGYHIIEYTSDVASEVAPVETISANLYDMLYDANKSWMWLNMIDLWPEELNLQFKNEELNDASAY